MRPCKLKRYRNCRLTMHSSTSTIRSDTTLINRHPIATERAKDHDDRLQRPANRQLSTHTTSGLWRLCQRVFGTTCAYFYSASCDQTVAYPRCSHQEISARG